MLDIRDAFVKRYSDDLPKRDFFCRPREASIREKMNLYRAVLPMLAHDKESLCMFTINVFVGEARTVLQVYM